jgi:hypothetical protein
VRATGLGSLATSSGGPAGRAPCVGCSKSSVGNPRPHVLQASAASCRLVLFSTRESFGLWFFKKKKEKGLGAFGDATRVVTW